MKLERLSSASTMKHRPIFPAVPASSSTSPQQILLIDDSITMRTLLEVHLCRAGYTCQSFAEGASALRWLCQPATCPPRLLLLDLELPGMDGYQVARSIRAHPRWNAMGLVILSSHDRVTDRLKGRLLGAQAYLTKPFQIEQLLQVVQEVLHSEPPNQDIPERKA